MYRQTVYVLIILSTLLISWAFTGEKAVAQEPRDEVTAQTFSFEGDTLPPLRAVDHQGQPAPVPEDGTLETEDAEPFVIMYNSPICTWRYGGDVVSWPPAAQEALEYAADRWASLLVITQTIRVNACWAESAPLGQAGATTVHRNFAGAPVSNTNYPVALANQLAGGDLNDNDIFDVDHDGSDVDAEIDVFFRSNPPLGGVWYFGLDGNPGSSEIDFLSVALHELGHGLGFSGSMEVTNGVGSWGGFSDYPGIFDRFAEDNAGVSLLNTATYPNPSGALAAALTDEVNGVFLNSPRARSAIGDTKVQLFTPDTWLGGSSYSHLGEFFNHTSDGLMTYSISDGEATHQPGSVMLGLFSDMGWELVQDRQSFTYFVYLPLFLKTYPFDVPIPCVPDSSGSGNSFATAEIICSGQTVSGRVGSSNSDRYKIYVENYQRLTVSVQGSGVGGPGDVDIWLLDPDSISGDTLITAASVEDGNEEFINGIVLKSGYYYLYVYHKSSVSGSTNYTLTATISSP